MNVDPRCHGARRSRWSTLAAFALMAGGWGVGAARADIQVNIKNCTDFNLTVEAYDANDTLKAVPASKTQLAADSSGESKQLHCAGEGEGHCQMDIQINLRGQCSGIGGKGDFDFHLESGKWAVVTASGESSCELGIEKDLDSAPSSCS
jgi:hypothetical protein